MRNTLSPEAKRMIDATLQPVIDTFAAAVAEMRAAGVGDEEVEKLMGAALEACPGPLDPSATAYMIEKLRKAGNDR